MKKDLQDRSDIKVLIDGFYARVLEDRLLSPIFLEVAKINLAEHLPILYDFWESVLFQAGSYKRNAMKHHIDLHMQHPLKEEHFNRWLLLFNETVNELYEGEMAEEAKKKALSVATVIKMKINNLDRMRLEINN